MGKVKRITDEQIQKIVKMYLDDYSKVYIAKYIGISTQSVTKYLVKNNIKQKEHFLSNETKELICKMYICDNKSIKEICEELNVDCMSVKRALKKNGIKLRSLSDALRKYDLDKNYFDNIDTPNKAYILGFLYADGNVRKDKYVMQITLQEEDKHILEKFKIELNTNRPLYFKESKNKNIKNTYTLVINNKHMHQ